MNTAATKILFHLTGEKEIEKVPLETLQKLVEENPYFPLTQFFFVKKLKEEKSENYLAQLQKSALFFSNPHWLNFQLKNIDHPIKIVEEQKAEEIITPIEPTQDKVIIIEADETEISFEIETPIVEDFELLENIEPIVEEKSVPGVEANIEQNEEIAESIEIKNNIENIAEKKYQ